jgi:FkbM family methyltransferase
MRVLFVAPHLSTGGMPQYLLQLMRKMTEDKTVEIFCVEYSCISRDFVVQRNLIKDMLGDRFISLSDSHRTISEVISSIKPDVVHFQEMPEYFMQVSDMLGVYDRSKNSYLIVETSHDSSFDITKKKVLPDHFIMVSEYQKNRISPLGIPVDVVEYDIEYFPSLTPTEKIYIQTELGMDVTKKHVLHVGLFTPRKNQKEFIQYAQALEKYSDVVFHCVGNMADNFKSYWEPITSNLPSNVVIHGERSDVHKYFSASDLFLFTSRGGDGDMETSPLVIREAIGHDIPTLIYNLPVYGDMYSKYKNIRYLNFDSFDSNVDLILDALGIEKSSVSDKLHTLNGVVYLDSFSPSNSMISAIDKYGDVGGSQWAYFQYDELDLMKNRGISNVSIPKDSVFLDLGANIGMASVSAAKKGAKFIYAVEPDPRCKKIIEQNLSEYDVTTTVFVNHVDYEDSNVILRLWPSESIGDKSIQFSSHAITLESLLKKIIKDGHPIIDYVKMDIEGGEHDVLPYALNASLMSRIRFMMIESHSTETTKYIIEDVLLQGGFEFIKFNVEYGNGQDYIYVENTQLGRLDSSLLNHISFDSLQNRIYVKTNADVSDCRISVRDSISGALIWSFTYDLLKRDSLIWMMPISKEYYDFENSPTFSGFIVDIFSGEYLVHSSVLKIKDVDDSVYDTKPFVQIHTNTEPIFINYNEFFVQRIYDEYLDRVADDFKNSTNVGVDVLDIGANVGLWSSWLFHKLSEKMVVNVQCIEPNPIATKCISTLNRSIANIEILQSALVPISKKDDVPYLVCPSNNTTIGKIEYSDGNSNNVDSLGNVSAVTAMDFSSIEYDMVKMDIEGGEYSVLGDFVEHVSTKSYLIEYHLDLDMTEEDKNAKIQELVNVLKSKYSVYVSEMHSTGGFIFAKRFKFNRQKSGICIVRTTDIERSVSFLTDVNTRLHDVLPISYLSYSDVTTEFEESSNLNCDRPFDVVSINKTPSTLHTFASNDITPAHFGNYKSFREVVLGCVDTPRDFIVVCEEDAKFSLQVNDDDIRLFLDSLWSSFGGEVIGSLGGPYDIETGILQSPKIRQVSSVSYLTNKIIGCQALVIPKPAFKWVKEMLMQSQWDALDIFLNKNARAYSGLETPFLVSSYSMITQSDGMSLIDGRYKNFLVK